jgi:hypothetical protein
MPSQCGGLAFTNNRLMNECLLAKWIIKLERGDGDLCCNLLRKKYLKGKSIFSSTARGSPSCGKAYMS